MLKVCKTRQLFNTFKAVFINSDVYDCEELCFTSAVQVLQVLMIRRVCA